MATNIKGPAIFLAQFAGDAAPFNSLGRDLRWAAGLGYKGVQIPTWDARLFDLAQGGRRRRPIATRSPGIAARHGVAITELSTHLQGQLVAVHPAYDEAFDAFAPGAVRGKPEGAPGMGGRADDAGRQGLAQSRPDGACRASPARWPGPISIPGRSGRRA